VNPVTPTLTTQAGAGPVILGNPIYDRATIGFVSGTDVATATQPGTNGPNSTYPSINATNGAPAGGTITFTAYGPNDCSTVAYTSSAYTISGDGTYPAAPGASFTPTATGTYHWYASYSGNSPNTNSATHNGSCTDTSEDVTVNQAPTSITTRQFVYPQDKAVVTASAGGNVAGTVTFKLFGAGGGNTAAQNCAAGAADSSYSTGLLYSPAAITVAGTTSGGVSSASATTNNTTVKLASDSTVYWLVVFASTNNSQLGTSSACTESTQVAYAGNDTNISLS
jgi:hypothetical protein